MGKGRDFSIEEKIRIQCWLGENVPIKVISDRLGRHPGAVRKIAAKIRELKPGSSLERYLKKVLKIGIFK